MEESLTWILTNFQEVTVTGLLALIIIGRFKGWWYEGATYRKCESRNATFEAAAKEHADHQASELAALRSEVANLRDTASRRRS